MKGGTSKPVPKRKTTQKKAIPVTPQKARENMLKSFPEWVIEGINNAIAKEYRGQSSFTISQEKIVEEILLVAPESVKRGDLFDKNYLDFEKLYQKFGWNVTYDKPGYCESYEAFFVFKPRG